MAETCLTIRFDASRAVAAMQALPEAFASLPLAAAERLREPVEGFLRRVEAGEQVFFVQREGAVAAGADEVVVVLDPSDGLVGLLAAVRAGDGDGPGVEHRDSFGLGGCHA